MADMTRVGMRVRGAEVVTVPIDDTLTIEGQAADAKATGDALALKADKSELQAAVKVNNQPADAQGLILIDGRHIPVSDQDEETLAEAVTDLKGQTAENIPMSSDSGAKTIAEVVNANAEAIENMEEMTGATMPIESGSQTTVKAAIEARVKTVNQKAPDTDGNVNLSVVPLAENLQSDKMQSVDGTFIIRTTGGSSSVSDGKAYPQHIMGTSERTGYVAEELNMTVIPIERTEPDEPITATIDRDVFVAYVDESGTINLYYTTEWSEDPELYGVTVEGTPVAGDQIKIVYVKEERGTIMVADPDRLVGTGWNLFSYNNGYARVVKYSNEYGYKIGGTFTSIEFSETLEGNRVSILPGQNGLFQVPGDGYVFVSGGNATDTYILATWSDWMEGPSSGYWEPYRESGIDLSAVMGTYFPYGMLSVGTIHDEIDLSAKRTISRVERLAYTAENLAAAIASGREYTYDTNYIYLVRAEYVISAITIDTVYNVSEHGMEWFTETDMPLITEILYGKNLRDKLERDVLTISQQTLAEEEKAQVRRNIGVMDPPTNGNGTLGQLLKTNGDGTTEWTTQGTPTDAQVGTAVSAWLTAHPEATTTVQDGAISRAKLNDDLKAKTDAVPYIANDVYEEELLTVDSTTESYKLNSNGLSVADSNYKLLKFSVSDMETVKIISDHEFQFQDSSSVPSVNPSHRIGDTYKDGTYILSVPTGATYLIVSTTKTGSIASVYNCLDLIEQENTTEQTSLSFVIGGLISSDGSLSPSSTNRIASVVPYNVNYIRPNAGYQIALYGWNNGTYIGVFNGTAFVTSLTWFSNEVYPLQIKKAIAVTDIVAVARKKDNSTFSEIPSNVVTVKRLVKTSSVYAFEASTVKRKTLNMTTGLINDSTARLMQNHKYVNAGDVVRIKPNGMYYLVCVRSLNKTVYAQTDSANWESAEKSVAIQNEGQLIIMFGNGQTYARSSTIYPSDYVADVVLIKDENLSTLFNVITSNLEASGVIKPYRNLAERVNDSESLKTTGETESNNSYVTTDYIRLPKWGLNQRYNPFTTVYAMSYSSETGENEGFVRACFYDASKAFISYSDTSPLTIPSDAVYVRVTFSVTNMMYYVGCGILTQLPSYAPYHSVFSEDHVQCIANTIHNSDGAKTNIVRTALQYCGNPDFGYGNTHTAYSASSEAVESDGVTSPSGSQSSDVTYPGEKFQIDCSGFTRLTVQCIYPKYTRHYIDKNIPPQWGYKFDDDAEFDTPEGRLTAHKQALYAYQRGFLYPINNDFSNVEVGDLIFVSKTASGLFDEIGHSRFVANVEQLKNGGYRLTVIEANSYVYPSVHASKISVRPFNQYSAARLPLPYASIDQTPIGIAQASQKTLTSDDKVIAVIPLSETLKDKEIYTIVFDAEFDSENYCIVTGMGDSFNFNDLMAYDGKHCHSVLLPVDGSAGSDEITISANSAGTVTFGGAKVYKGFYTP